MVIQQAIIKQNDKPVKTIQPIVEQNKSHENQGENKQPIKIHKSTLTTVTKPIILHNSVIVLGRVDAGEKPAPKPKVPVPKAPCPCKAKTKSQAKSPCARKPPQSKSNHPCPKESKQDKACDCPPKIPPTKPKPKVNDNEPDILQTIKK